MPSLLMSLKKLLEENQILYNKNSVQRGRNENFRKNLNSQIAIVSKQEISDCVLKVMLNKKRYGIKCHINELGSSR